MDLHPDFSDLLAEFARVGVSYALLGGYAVGVYAEPRATKDLDLLVSGQGDNLARVASALAAFGAPRHEAAIQRAIPADLGSLRVFVISREDLIANKRASGRPQDLADVAALERTRP